MLHVQERPSELRNGRQELADAIQQGGARFAGNRSTNRIGTTLVAGEITLTVVLVVSSALL